MVHKVANTPYKCTLITTTFPAFQVSKVLHKYLTEDQYADYDHFIKMKAKLIMDAREIDDKIKLGEEQQKALRDMIIKKQ